ncbi:hypothetical protein Tco_1072706 [Tanacetum coccineum]
MRETKAYKTYLGYATGVTPPKKALKFKKPASPKLTNMYGYCKNHKKTVKIGQTRTQEWKECTRAGSLIAKRSKVNPWSAMVNSQKTKKPQNSQNTLNVK